MRLSFFRLFALIAVLGSSPSSATSANEERCVSYVGQTYCAPLGGTLTRNFAGHPVCGLGQCVKDSIGRISCSAVPGGAAMITSVAQILCVGGCTPPDQRHCMTPQ
jgi:hypothetical protein